MVSREYLLNGDRVVGEMLGKVAFAWFKWPKCPRN